jgi:hypothetical protein
LKFFYLGSMKKKPLLITITCLVVALVCIFFFVKAKYFRKPNANEITQFIKDFDAELRSGNMDSLRNFFEGGGNAKTTMLIKTLANKASLGEKSDPDFTTSLDADDAQILMSNSDIAIVKVPVTFSHANFDLQKSSITFTIRRLAEHQYKFIKVKAEAFAKDYLAYKDKIDAAFPTEKPVEYSPITLAAFKSAETLKGVYDTVVWFQHIGDKNYFYAVNGKWDTYKSFRTDTAKTYKMGLVGPDFKVIIPIQYDIIHNINGTFNGMVEVDKDNKHGFYTLDGKLVVPVEYDQIIPLHNDNAHLAVMLKGNDYFWLNKDNTISNKADIQIADILSQIRGSLSFSLAPPDKDVMECNSRDDNTSILVSPSYLVDLNIMPLVATFKNPLRKNTEDEDGGDGTTAYDVDLDHSANEGGNALETLFYDIKNHFIGGRVDLYEDKSLIVVDKRSNRLLSHSIEIEGGEDGAVPTTCNDYSYKVLPDSIFEVKVSASVYISIPTDTISDEYIDEMPAYHYFKIANNKLEELVTKRQFAFTKFVKMDDSYLKGCYSYYVIVNKNGSSMSTEYLKTKFYQYLVNEIYADYNYKFKNDKWNDNFKDSETFNGYEGTNTSVDDSLTAIDKYNISFLKQKMAGSKANRIAMK